MRSWKSSLTKLIRRGRSAAAEPSENASQPLVVTFCDAAFIPVLQNWLCGLSELGIERVKVFALDDETAEWASAAGVDARLIGWNGDLASLWVARVEVFRDLLEQGITFVHSDTDAMWLRDPFAEPGLLRDDADMIFSQGTVWPEDVFDRHGLVLCCGWFLARPTKASKRFLADLARDVARTGDDQVSLNRLLLRRAIQWDHGGAARYDLAFDGRRSLTCWTHTVLGRCRGRGPRIALLPHRAFQRIPEPHHDVYVKHFLTPKTAAAKLALFAEHGLLHDARRREGAFRFAADR